jgi:hypothetical protein
MENFKEIMRREAMLKKVFVTEHKRNSWKKVINIMGILPDKKIAKKMGVTVPCVAAVRSKMGIAPVSFPKLCTRYGADFKGYMYMI